MAVRSTENKKVFVPSNPFFPFFLSDRVSKSRDNAGLIARTSFNFPSTRSIMPSFDEKERERGALPCSETRQQSGVKERFARGWKSSTRFFPVFYFISPFLSFFLFFYFYLPSGVADRHRPLFLTHPVLRAYRVLASNHHPPPLLSPIPVPQRGGSPWDVIYSCFQRSFKRTFPFSLVKMYQPRFPSRHFFSLSLSFSLPLPEIPLSLFLALRCSGRSAIIVPI